MPLSRERSLCRGLATICDKHRLGALRISLPPIVVASRACVCCIFWDVSRVHFDSLAMEPYRRSVPYLRTAERNRLAKMRFLNATTTADPVPATVASPSTDPSSDVTDHTEPSQQLPPPPNPFTAFLESMDQLRTGQSSDRQADRLMEVLAALEQQATQTAAEATPPKQPNGAFERDYYGYRHAGTFNGRSTLRVWPSVRRSLSRSLSRRSSVDSLHGAGGYASDGGAARETPERQRVGPLASGE